MLNAMEMYLALIVLFLGLESAHAVTGMVDVLPIKIHKPPSFEVWVGDENSETVSEALGFPLQRTEVQAQVVSGVASVKVKQVYRNDGAECLQSRYIFPLPTKAAISAMSMRIGNRNVIGNIRTRADARQEFNDAKASGSAASLLDQERPNVFSMELANILPGETTEVTVEYSETLVPTDGVYAFVFPAVVGPRYGKGWEPGADTSNLTTHIDISVAPSCLGMESDLQMNVFSKGGLPTHASLSAMSTDAVVKFWFTEKSVQAQLLLAQRGQDKYFSLSIQPPQRRLLASDQIAKREYLFILDVSGSMKGYPIDLSKSLMRKLLKENVRAGDSLNIMLFAGGSAVLSEEGNIEATPANIEAAEAWLEEKMKSYGSTQLLPALQRAFALPRFDTAVSRTIVVMTDGYVTVEKEAFDLVREKLGDGNVFVFGIGQSVNRYLIEGLARVGYGEPFVVMDEKDGDQVVQQLQHYIDTPVLTQLSLSFDGSFTPMDQEPPYLPDVFASRPIQVVGKWKGELAGNLKLTGRLANGEPWEFSQDLAQMDVVDSPSVPMLWARSRIAILSDFGAVGEDAEKEVTALGLNYSLMTQYTSFVAVDSDPVGPATCLVKTPSDTTEAPATADVSLEEAGGSSGSTGTSTGGMSGVGAKTAMAPMGATSGSFRSSLDVATTSDCLSPQPVVGMLFLCIVCSLLRRV